MTEKKALWANANHFFITQPNSWHEASDIQQLRQHVQQLGVPYVEEQLRVNLKAAQQRWHLYAQQLHQLSFVTTALSETETDKK